MVSQIVFLIFFAIHFSKSASSNLDKSVTRLIEDYGYLVESHNIVTKDGYILEIHRIPGIQGENITDKKNKPVVLMMAGLLNSSPDWIVTGPNRSLAFLLVQSGYDVWLGNNRGNTFGKNHKSFLTTSFRFWDFSWHEMGVYDLPATIDYILKRSKFKDLTYVCFSQGCTQFLVMGSLKPEYNKKIRFTTAIAPASGMKYIKGTALLTEPFLAFSKILTEKLGYFEFLPSFPFLRILTNYVCREENGLQNLCYFVLFYTVGIGLDEIDRTHFPDVLAYFPAGCSWKQILHFSLSFRIGYFGQYDYGLAKNLRLYNSSIPPEYPLQNVNVPTAIFHGTNDFLTSPKDVAILAKKLPNLVCRYFVTERKLNHIDFLYGRNIRNLVYNRILKMINSFRKN